MPGGGSFPPGDDSRTPTPGNAREVIGHVTENLSSPLQHSVRATSLAPIGTPTRLELQLEKMRAEFALTAKYPLRPFSVLSPEQLAAARAQLGPAAFVPPKAVPRSRQDRHPLTPDEVRAARELARR